MREGSWVLKISSVYTEKNYICLTASSANTKQQIFKFYIVPRRGTKTFKKELI